MQTSVTIDESYAREFAGAQAGTPTSSPVAGDAEFRAAVTRSLVPHRDIASHDSVIIRFYEEVIQGLQRELARYKLMVNATFANTDSETEPDYVSSAPVSQPANIKSKLLSISGNYMQAPDLDL